MGGELDRVGIFIAGVQKGGTTCLHSYFQDHPQLLAPRKKETHYFDNETLDWSSPDYENGLHRKFYPAPRSGARAYDATPISIFWPPSIARILDYNPKARFILLFRDPIERAFSHWRMEFDRKADEMPFSAAIREGRNRLSGLPELHPDRRVYTYVERGFYGQQVDGILKIVPREQLLFLPSAELASNPATVLGQIADFLSIDPFPDTSPRRVFEGAPLGELTGEDVDYLRSIFLDETLRFSDLTGIDVCHWSVCMSAANSHAV